jgi:hypothetical protein
MEKLTAIYERTDDGWWVVWVPEIAGEDPTPLEVLLTEWVVSLWMLTTVLEAVLAGQYRRVVGDASERPSPSYLLEQSRILESATRRYLAAVRELARVRRLQAGAPRPGP